MKRGGHDAGPPLKRFHSEGAAPAQDESGDYFALRSQNKALSLELVRYKRQIGESREELEMIRGKSREMETLVGVIQRAWSQLDIDASMLLDCLGDSDIPQAESENELLLRLLSAGSSSRKVDPTDLNNLPQLQVDNWSTEEQVEAERQRAEKEQEDEAMNTEFGGKIEDTLAEHSTFTLTLLERLCTAIGEAGTLTQAPEVINALTEAKALHADRLLLTDRITKLSSEIVNLSAKLHNCERQKMMIERDLIRAQASATEVANRAAAAGAAGGASADSSSSNAAASSSSSSTSDATSTESAPAPASHTVVFDAEADERAKEKEKAMERKIATLEKQLSQSEADKSKADMELTRRLAQPMAQQETATAPLRKVIDELRNLNKKQVLGQNSDTLGFQEKINNLEIAMQQLEASCAAKCKEATGQAEVEIKSMKASRDSMQSSLFKANADLAMNAQLKKQVAELQSLEAAGRAEAIKLKERIKALTENQEMMQTHLANSRSREAALEEAAGSKAAGEGSENGGADLLAQAQQRASEAQKEFEQAQVSINDLILEIDAVDAEGAKAREQSARALKAQTDAQSSLRNVTEDNSRLHDQIADLQRRNADMENRLASSQAILKQQEQLVSQLVSLEQSLRSELHTAKTECRELQGKNKLSQQALTEAQEKLGEAVRKSDDSKKLNADLEARCADFSAKAETERRARMAAEREARPKPLKRERTNDSAAPLNGEDSAMLEMTLGMLRCSVCRERFKEVCITRCFHVFCKECIDENLRTRHRKCPCCGEKFGEIDCKKIF